MKKKKSLWIVIFLLPTVVMFGLIYLGPLITVIVSSFTKWNGFEPMRFVGLKNYKELLQDEAVHTAFINTLKWGVWAAFVHVPFGVIVALILAKKPFGWKFTRSVFMIPNVISQTALAILFLFIYKPEVGILNEIIQKLGFKDFSVNWLYNPKTAFVSVTFIWLFYAAVITLITMSELFGIPKSLYEAARIDGATSFQIDLYINLPLLRNIIGTGVIIAVTSVFKMFDVIYLTTNGGPGNKTINLAVMMVNSIFNTMRYGYANTLAVMLLLIGIVVMVLIQKIFRMHSSSYE